MQHWLKGVFLTGLSMAFGVACDAAPRHSRPAQATVLQVPAGTNQPTLVRAGTVRRPGDQPFQQSPAVRVVKKPAEQRTLSMQQVNQFAFRETHAVEPGIPVEQAAEAGQ